MYVCVCVHVFHVSMCLWASLMWPLSLTQVHVCEMCVRVWEMEEKHYLLKLFLDRCSGRTLHARNTRFGPWNRLEVAEFKNILPFSITESVSVPAGVKVHAGSENGKIWHSSALSGRCVETINAIFLKFCTWPHDENPHSHGKIGACTFKNESVRRSCSETSISHFTSIPPFLNGIVGELGGPFPKPSTPSL